MSRFAQTILTIVFLLLSIAGNALAITSTGFDFPVGNVNADG